ncbi:MAG: DUF4845 domain-containing protein [Cellvibrio sp. 79]|nr:MAG: DUF4845 domain-containing protein [Cellvibrio sp. 79]
MKNVQIKSLKHQHGLGMLQWLVVIVVIAALGKFAFTVIPLYSENIYVRTALKSLANDSTQKLEQMSDQEIRKKLSNFYMINNVNSEGPNKNIKIERESEKTLVTVDYETRANYIWNMDVIVSFKNHLDSTRPGQCCNPAPTAK